MDEQSFYTPARTVATETAVKGSRFVATLNPVGSKQQADTILAEISGRHASAAHHCFAYRFGAGDDCIYRVDDAGEPGGTGGKPILQALEARNVSNAILVVTRYFGGTKLGIGGLIRAYSAAAFAVLDRCRLTLVEPTSTMTISFQYDDTGNVHKILHQYDGVITNTRYGACTKMDITAPRKNARQLVAALRNITRGEIAIE